MTLRVTMLCFLPKIVPNSAKSDRIFSSKGRGDRTLILTYLDSWMVKLFLLFFILVIFSGKKRIKTGLKVQTLGPFLFHKNSIFFTMFFLQEYYPDRSKTLKIFNSTATNAILMKLTSIIYLQESVKQKLLEPEIQLFGLISRNF